MLGEENIKTILRDFGLTETEGEVYLFLSSHHALKGTEIARQLQKDKAQIYHILKSLQTKGLVESTLEAPIRFTPVPFETVVESIIRAKKDEAARIESIKQELFDYWKTTRKGKPEPPLEKFMVIEGSSKIYLRILDMISKTKHKLSAVSTVQALQRADRFGVFDAVFQHPLKSQVQFRFLTELSEQNVQLMKALLKNEPMAEVNFKSRNPDFGLHLSPHMVIQDEEELLLFITPRTDELSLSKTEICLWTNCKTLVQSFCAVFEDFWGNAEDTEEKIALIEAAKTTPIDPPNAVEVLRLAEREILMMTSSVGLLNCWKNMLSLKERSEGGVLTKIMAPITSENMQAAQELSRFCTIKHVSTNHLETVIVDGNHLFQFKEPPLQGKPLSTDRFNNYFYTNDLATVKKTKDMLDNIWRNAQVPSAATLESILEHVGPTLMPLSARSREVVKERGVYVVVDEKPISEKDVLDKIVHAKKYLFKDGKGLNVMYATAGSAVIHPPDYFNLPDTMISVFHIEKQSSLGEEDAMIIFLWLDTPNGQSYEPVAIIGDNPAAQFAWKTMYPKSPVPKNTLLVQKDEIQIRVHGDTLFAGWTIPIPLFPPQYTLPPACLQIEGYGDVKTVAYTIVPSLGRKTTVEQNYFDAFVTFFHPSSKYSGPGTDGYFVRDLVASFPPKT